MRPYLSRRQLLKLGAAGAAGAFSIPHFIPFGVLAADGRPGANERIAVGVIGVGTRVRLLIDQLPDKTALYQAGDHLQNWLDCIASRQTPNAGVEIGHRSASICHLWNIASEVRRRIRWDPRKEQIVGDDEVNRLVDRPRRKGHELPEASS